VLFAGEKFLFRGLLQDLIQVLFFRALSLATPAPTGIACDKALKNN